MILLNIKNTKDFMGKFLGSEVFDEFLLDSAELKLASTFNIDGHINRDFFSGDDEASIPEYELASWSDVRSKCFDLIKGKKTPLSFKFIMCTTPDKKDELLSSEAYSEVRPLVSSFVFIIKYTEGMITITTGTAMAGFTLDKAHEKLWDDHLKAFLAAARIDFEEAI